MCVCVCARASWTHRLFQRAVEHIGVFLDEVENGLKPRDKLSQALLVQVGVGEDLRQLHKETHEVLHPVNIAGGLSIPQKILSLLDLLGVKQHGLQRLVKVPFQAVDDLWPRLSPLDQVAVLVENLGYRVLLLRQRNELVIPDNGIPLRDEGVFKDVGKRYLRLSEAAVGR